MAVIDLVTELEKTAVEHHLLNQAAQPWSDADQRKLAGDLRWRAADEIKRLRHVIARNCDPSADGVSAGDAAIIETAIRWADTAS